MSLKLVQSLAYANFIAYVKFLTNFSSFFFPTFSVKEDGLLIKPFQKPKQGSVVHRQFAAEEWDREEARKRRCHLIAMDAYERHKKFVKDYILYYGGKIEDFRRSGANDKTDLDVIRENHRFLWNEEDEADMNWEKRLAKKYYDKLFKEYCIADLSRYKENKVHFSIVNHFAFKVCPFLKIALILDML
uniref:FRA10A associated CGG repeat 1 n=1 Tax=Amazona collaria TaxID=241587 RepID=A0A8B9IS60_9PSIT